MANVLKGLKPRSVSATPSSKHDLELAIESAGDARDIAKDLLRRLPDYDSSEDESTARHEMPINVTVHTHMSGPSPSHPDIETETAVELHGVKVTGLPRWVIALAIPAAGAITGLVTWLLSR